MAGRKSVQNARNERWTRLQRAPSAQRVTFRVTLAAARSDAELEARVLAVADAASPAYGQYARTSAELAELWAPHAEATQALEALAASVDGLEAVANDARDVWTLRMAAATAESLFAAELFEFAHQRVAGLTVVRPGDGYRLPNALAGHVVYIDGLENFPTEVQAQFMARDATDRGALQNGDPFAVKHHTLDADKREVVTPAMIRAQYDIPDDLALNGSHPRNRLVIGSFLREFYSEVDLAAFLAAYDPVFARSNPPLPATRGDCVAGRPGSSATLATGEASLDIQVASAIARSTNVEMVCYTNLRDDARPQAADNQEPFLAFLQEVNAMDPPPAVVSLSYTDDECSVPRAYALAVNRELMKAALRGVTVLISAGDAGAQGSHLAGFCGVAPCSRFLANFPASSPYVTAVGATTLDTARSSSEVPDKFREVVTSTEDGALITSGGGFSELFGRPAYQDRAVGPYLAYARAAGLAPLFNADGRAYPDIAGLGHAFPVIQNGKMFPTDGTSVSAPLLAAMIVLLNRQRLAAGKPALGFLNPLLYQLYDVCPDVFADVTEGDIACGSRDMACCARSHAATVGWDAASGVGTLRFQQFASRLDGCIELIRSQRAERLSLLADSGRSATLGQHELLLSVALLAGVVLASALVALRFRRSPREPAREHLLASDPRRV
ncbi:hypothetical protein PybrP1_009553 [[Pythium] brassicae (nom. inval.)]|nr:hypothetical protein PybrP1_009553 [[Pythium] brassicae (nom. inval.)]